MDTMDDDSVEEVSVEADSADDSDDLEEDLREDEALGISR